jgi:hypothetical protein
MCVRAKFGSRLTPGHYVLAAQWLEKVALAYATLGREDAWGACLDELIERHRRWTGSTACEIRADETPQRFRWRRVSHAELACAAYFRLFGCCGRDCSTTCAIW